MWYDIIVLEHSAFLYMSHDCVTVTYNCNPCNIILNPNSKFKIRK